jgi:ABC-2 type transport system ATP-binding protein
VGRAWRGRARSGRRRARGADYADPGGALSTPLVAARGAGRRFGSHVALEPTDFELHDGETVALVGPNGAGKSTLLALLAGALEPTKGRVERRGDARIGWAPQRAAQYGRLSPRENLELFARLEGETEPEARAGRLLAEFELPIDGGVAGDLSVGNRQRLNLAIALLAEPDALLLDEPTAALDPEQRERLWARLETLRLGGKTLLFVTQHADEVERADRVLTLRQGAVVA